MAPDLVAALKAGWAIVHFVTVSLPGHTIRWTDAGFARWGSGVWKARDPIFGTLHEISDITDGIDDDASPVTLTITPPSMAALEAMASADAQGGWVVIHLAAIDPATGALATPYQLHMGELDQPRLAAGKVRRLEYDIITGDARGLQPNEEQRQSDAFRQLIWPGERGDEFATDGTKQVWWREDEPRNAVGLLSGRGGDKKDDNKAIEFSYEPNAPLAFPFGRVGVGGTLRYRVGYGPTNRWQSVVATVGASGPVKGLVSASFDDEVTFFDANNRATNGSHRGEMWFSFLPGAQPSPALTAPTGPNADGGPAGLWSPAHKLSGRPCFMWTGKENSKKSEYRGGLVKPVLTIDGLYGYDPLLDSTRGGDGTCRIDNPTTWPWLNEGARAALNWAIGRWEGRAASGRYGVPYQSWAVGGIAAPIQTIDVQAFAHAARIADANNWKVAAVPRSDEDKVDVLNDLLKASGAVRSRRCGMISCVSFGAPTPSVLTATPADTIAAPQVSLAPSRLDRRNTGIPSFLSAQHRWELTPIAAVTDQEWFEEDGGRHTEGYSYRYVPAAKQAAQLCYLEMATEREKVEAEVTFKPWMVALEPGMGFDWAAREYGLDGTKVRVWKRTWSPRSCSVKIKFREETDAKYAKAFAQTGEAPPAFAPPLPPVVSVPVNRPVWTSDPYPVTGSPGTIQVAAHEAMMPWGEIVSIAGAIISGLDGTKIYGVFWRPADSDGQGGGVEVEAYPASSHMADGSWIFLGWQAPANELGEFPPLPVAPPGHGGIGEAPGLPIAGDTTHLNGEPVQDVLDRLTDTATLADQNRQAVEALEEVYGDTASAATSAAAAAASEAAANQAKADALIAKAGAESSASAAQTAKTAAETARAGAETAQTSAANSATTATGAASTATTQAGIATTAKNDAQAASSAAVTAKNQASSFADAAGVSAAASQASSVTATAARDGAVGAAIAGIPDAISADLWTDLSSSGEPASRPNLPASRVVGGAYVAPTGAVASAGPKQRVRWVQGKVIEIRLRAEVPAGAPASSARIGVARFSANHANLNSDSWMALTAVAPGASTEVTRRIGCGVAVPGGSTINLGPEWLSLGCSPNLNAAGSAAEPGAQMRITAFSVRDVTEQFNASGSASAAATSASSAAASEAAAGQSASAASTAKTQAETARGQAQTAATQAASSRDDAAGSAASASTSAMNAANSRDAAAGSATAAAGSASTATTKATEAGNSAAAAQASQVAATAAKDGAETARGQAQSSASAASTSASSAAASATTAGEKATAAAGSATTAATRAGEALTYRNQAASSASDAAGSAATASTASGTAVAARNDAQAAAATAVAQSSSASASAASAQLSANLAAQVGSRSGNLLSNTDFAATAGWTANVPLNINGGPAMYHPLGERVLTVTHATAQVDVYSSRVSVEAGKWYEVSAYLLAHRSQVKLFIRWVNAAGGYISSPETAWTTKGGGGNSSLSDYTRLWLKAKAPVGAVAAVLMARKSTTQSGPDSWMWMARPMLAETSETATGPALYTVGSGRDVLPAVEAQASLALSTSVDALTRLGQAAFELILAANDNPAYIKALAGPGGSEIAFAATKILLRNVVGDQIVNALELINGEAYFGAPVSVDISGRRLTIGPGFGVSNGLVLWFGPNTVALTSMSRTNGYFALGTDGKVYYGSAELGGGKTSGAKQFASGAGGTAASTVVSNVAAGSLINIYGSVDGGSLKVVNGTWHGTATVTESSGGTTTLYAMPISAVAGSLVQPNGSYQVEIPAQFSGQQIGARSGSVTYTVNITRTSGAEYEDGGTINAVIIVTPPV